jgi:transcriptional regulator with XRE-family HTH domain
MNNELSTKDLEEMFGNNIKQLRLQKNIDRQTLCTQAGLSLTALKNLENGQGSTITTLIKTMRALGRTDALKAFAPSATINPLQMVKATQIRQRARIKKAQ